MNPELPASPTTPTPPAPELVKPSTAVTPAPASRSMLIYPLTLGALLIGVGLGYLLFTSLTGSTNGGTQPAVVTTESQASITLPTDAVQIQRCSDHRGTLYIRPSDIPVGPVYMVRENKVIGIEYMLAKDEFLNSKSYKDLAGLGAKIDHVNIGLLSVGHEGYAVPHYHVDMYTVSKEEEQAIVCPASSPVASGSAIIATPSAQVASPSAIRP